MKTVYVVAGEFGEYSDYHMWFVCAADTKAEAERIAVALNEWVGQHCQNEHWRDFCFHRNPPNPFDSQFNTDPTRHFGAKYSATELAVATLEDLPIELPVPAGLEAK
jgi:hypothetical protein